LAADEIRRARGGLAEARALLEIGSLEGTASRLYYAAFHAARAALAVRGMHAKTHSGQTNLYERTFGAAPLFGQLLDMRARADYGRDPFDVTAAALSEWAGQTEGFVDRCAEIVGEAVAAGPDEPDPPPDL
jgi:uncharacterized protein (UPF0332 family)